MNLIAAFLIGLVAAEHLYILWLEMFAWTAKGPKIFDTLPKDLFPSTKVMAANQGLYNGFLAVGLIWSLLIRDAGWANNVATFFLCCVVIAGVYGSLTITRKILFVQSLPAIVALAVLKLMS